MTRPFEPSFVTQKTRKNVGIKAEKRASTRFGAKVQPGSGALQGAKGDFKSESILFESKATEAASLSVKKAWLDKIVKEARETNREPALVVQFVDIEGVPKTNGSWVLIPERLLKELLP